MGAHLRNSVFEYCPTLFGRWKSSESVIANNTFRHNAQPILEMQLISTFYEGPILVDDVLIEDSTFELDVWPAPMAAELVVARNWSTNITFRNNRGMSDTSFNQTHPRYP